MLIYQRLRSEDAHIPDGYEAKTLIRSRTLTYRRLRGGELAHIPKVTKRRRSHTRRLRGEDAHTKQNAHIPKATRRRTCSYTKGYEAKTLTYQTATRRRRSYEAERSHTEGYEAENLLIYQRLRSEDARIPQQLQGNPPSYNPKALRTLRPKNHKMSDRREEQEKAPRIILQGSENYTLWRSYILGELKQKNCAWAVTGKPEPTKESVRSDIIAMGFKPTEMTAQALWTALSTEIKEHRASLSKAEGIIKNSVASKHQAAIEGKEAKEMWETLQTKFQHISPMSISRLILETTKLRLSDCTDIHEYCSKYQEAYDTVCGLIPTDSEIPAKGAEVLLQAGLLTGMGNEYSGIVSMMETEWKMGNTNIAESTKKLIRFAEIRKENDQTPGQSGTPKQSALFTSKPPKPSNRAPPGTCTNSDCIKKGNTQHYTDRCFLRYPELRPKHSLHQMRTKGSRQNRQSQTESPSETPSREI